MKSVTYFMSIIVTSASGICAMEPINHDLQKKSEYFVERLMSVPDKDQRQRLYTFLNCLKRINIKLPGIYQADIRQVFAPHLWDVIGQENMDNAKSLAYQLARTRVCDIENEDIKQHLLQKYFGYGRIQMHDQMHDDDDFNLRYNYCGIKCCCCLKPCVSAESCPAEICMGFCSFCCCVGIV